MPSSSTLSARRAHPHSRRASVISFAAYALATHLAAAPDAHAADTADDDRRHGGISGSAGLDAFVAATPGEFVGAAARARIEGEAWLGWTAQVPDKKAGIHLFPGPALDNRRGLIFAASAAGIAATPSRDETTRELDTRFTESLTLQFTPFLLRQRASYQRPIAFADGFWRSQRGALSLGGGLEIPAIFLIGPGTYDVRINQIAIDVDWLWFADGATAMDFRVETAFVEHIGEGTEGPRRVAVMDTHVAVHVVPIERDTHWIDREALHIKVDLVSLAGLRIADGWSFGLAGGIGVFVPAHLYDASVAPESTPKRSPQLMMPMLFADVVHRLSERPFVPGWSSVAHRYAGSIGPGIALGAGTFQRLDPTGSAVDVGGQLVVDARLDIGKKWFAGANAFGAVAQRLVVTDLGLPAGAPGKDSMLLLGRIDGHLDRQLYGPVVASASAFVEHTDRDDPIDLGGALPVAPRVRAGGLLSVSAVLR